MATGFISFTGLSASDLVDNMSVTVETTDNNGLQVIMCDTTGDFAGYTVSQFLDSIVSCINSSNTGFTATNANPRINISTTSANYSLAGVSVTLTFAPYLTNLGNDIVLGVNMRGMICVNNVASPLYGKCFSCGYSDDKLYVLQNQNILTSISLGANTEPSGVAYCPSNDCLYVSCLLTNTVKRIESDLVTITNIAVNTYPGAIIWNDFDGYIYVINGGSNNVSKINTTTNVATTVVVTLGNLLELQDNTSDGDVWVASYSGTTLKVIDTSAAVSAITVIAPITGIIYHPTTGNFYISFQTLNEIRIYDANGVQVGVITGLNAPTSLSYMPEIDIMSIATSNSVTFYNMDTSVDALMQTFSITGGGTYAAYNSSEEVIYFIAYTGVAGNPHYYGYVVDDNEYSGVFYDEATTTGNCPYCYEIELEACESSYEFDLGLTASTSYTIKFTNMFDKVYSYTTTTDVDGIFTVNTTNFPAAFFNPDSGTITMKIYQNGTLAEVVFGYTLYDCIKLNFNYETTVS